MYESRRSRESGKSRTKVAGVESRGRETERFPTLLTERFIRWKVSGKTFDRQKRTLAISLTEQHAQTF